MNDGIPYADIIILALIAGFILLRLRATLGHKTGRDEADFAQRYKAVELKEPIVQIIDKTLKQKAKDEPDAALARITDTAVVSALNAIKEKDPQFSVSRFLDGAHMAFEMVFDAFNKGDKQTLGMLLSEPLAKDFTAEVDTRSQNKDRRTDTTLVSVVSKEIVRAALDGSMAHISVKFTSEQITVIRNATNEIIEGNPSQTHHVIDEWVFERDITSKNPNWKIIET